MSGSWPDNIVLVGFMGTGKTVVGKLLARRLGYAFVDSDELIERRAGKPIKDIFATDGEPRFRQLEADIVAEVSQGRRQVIATGGGVLLRQENVDNLRRAGPLVCLRASPEAILARVGSGSERPLLAGAADPLGRVRELLAVREPYHALADRYEETDGRLPEQIADAILTSLAGTGTSMRSVRVELGDRSYHVHIGTGLTDRAGELIREAVWGARGAVVTHARLWQLHGQALQTGLEDAGLDCVPIPVPPGEGSKTWRRAEGVVGEMLAAGLETSCFVVAFGGGVVGDLAGFVAAVYMRGVQFVQIPTTLNAQVDSSVGGKVAINLPQGKNLIGAFHQPRVVIADVDLLKTMPPREYRSGLAEVIRYGVIADPHLFDFVGARARWLLAHEAEAVTHVVRRSCEIKADIVSWHEREVGLRTTLSFGHTIGHALEKAFGYRKLRHGEAVGLGMIAETEIAARRGLCPSGLRGRLEAVLQAVRLPIRLPEVDAQAVVEACRADKKRLAGRLRLVLPRAVGEVFVADDVAEDELRAATASLAPSG